MLLQVVLDLLNPAAQAKMLEDGYTLFGAFFAMMAFKGILVSSAGPAPNYDMQRILAAKTPAEQIAMAASAHRTARSLIRERVATLLPRPPPKNGSANTCGGSWAMEQTDLLRHWCGSL